MFSYSSLELDLAFLILDLYPKITNARKIQKEKNKPLSDKGIYEFANTPTGKGRQSLITKIKEETQQESTGC